MNRWNIAGTDTMERTKLERTNWFDIALHRRFIDYFITVSGNVNSAGVGV